MSSSSSSHTEISTPDLPWKHRVLLRFVVSLFDTILRYDITVNRWLIAILDRKIPPSPKPVNGISSSDLIIDSSRDLFFRIFTLTDGSDSNSLRLPVVIYYHGGGFVFGYADSKSIDIAARRLAEELRAVVISVNYRLAPEHRFPSPYEDGFDALKFVDDNINTLPDNADVRRCFIVGESAGGNLGHHVAVKASEYKFKKLKILGFIATQPFFGGEDRTESEIELRETPPLTLKLADKFWKAFLPEGSDRDHPATNVFGKNGIDISEMKFPATLIIVGGKDILKDWQKRYYEGLKRMGKEVKMVEFRNGIHGFFGFKDLQETQLMMQEFRDFMANQIRIAFS